MNTSVTLGTPPRLCGPARSSRSGAFLSVERGAFLSVERGAFLSVERGDNAALTALAAPETRPRRGGGGVPACLPRRLRAQLYLNFVGESQSLLTSISW
jgi:hypothetical protein